MSAIAFGVPVSRRSAFLPKTDAHPGLFRVMDHWDMHCTLRDASGAGRHGAAQGISTQLPLPSDCAKPTPWIAVSGLGHPGET